MSKKKICIIFICVLTFIILACLLFIFFNKKDIQIARIEENETLEDENIIEENIVSDEVEENNVVENTAIEDTTIIETASNETSNSVKNTTPIKSNQGSTQSQVQNNKCQISSVSKEETQKQATQVTTEYKTEENNQTITKEETAPAVPETNVEKYVRNDAMISRIKQIIQNNETSNMKNFGYNIVVDSSIKTQTNQFTFTESRVINAIKNKFGTIRIYVEDYYKNGQLIMTECYIL